MQLLQEAAWINFNQCSKLKWISRALVIKVQMKMQIIREFAGEGCKSFLAPTDGSVGGEEARRTTWNSRGSSQFPATLDLTHQVRSIGALSRVQGVWGLTDSEKGVPRYLTSAEFPQRLNIISDPTRVNAYIKSGQTSFLTWGLRVCNENLRQLPSPKDIPFRKVISALAFTLAGHGKSLEI